MNNPPVLLPDPPSGERVVADTPAALDQAAGEIAAASLLALDVEAGKPRGATTTVAALIQIAAPGHTWLVDPLRLSTRLDPLDRAFNVAPPVALFDATGDVRWLEAAGIHLPAATDLLQVTRSAYGESDKSLREALRRHFRVALDKSGQQADWLLRPISGPLRHYAARDAELTLALAGRYAELYPALMAIHTYPGGRAPIPDDLPEWLRRVLAGDRAPAYDLVEEDGLPIDQDESIPLLIDGANRALDAVRVPWQRARIYRAIANLELIELAPRVAAGLASICAVERTAAARALGELRAEDYAEALGVAQRDAVPDVARAATRALQNLAEEDEE